MKGKSLPATLRNSIRNKTKTLLNNFTKYSIVHILRANFKTCVHAVVLAD
jgi:hypothetical protein